MGKNRTVKSLGGIIANIVAHKILLKYTNKPESINHLRSEVETYRDNSLEIASEYNWNSQDKEKIQSQALKSLENELREHHFSGVTFPESEPKKLIKETLDEIL